MLKGQHIGESPIVERRSRQLVEEAKQKEWGGVNKKHQIYISALMPRRIDARIAGWSSGLACQAADLKVGGSIPSPATTLQRSLK